MTTENVILAMTGASGAAYGVRLLQVLLEARLEIFLTISPAAAQVLKQELDITVDLERFDPTALLPSGTASGQLRYCHYLNLMAPIASGSHLSKGMVICPCSTSTLGAIAHGTGSNLIHRAADVSLKERRKLILVPRETPLSLVHLENMKLAAEAGAVVLPAMPGFYHGAKSIQDLVDFVVARICDQLYVANSLMKRWGSPTQTDA